MQKIDQNKNKVGNFSGNPFNFFGKITIENRFALAVLTFSFIIIWFFNIGEYKTYIYNYSLCLSLVGVLFGLQSFFYCFTQITNNLKAKNWFTIGIDTLFHLLQLILLISGVKELTQRTDPFNTILFIFYAAIIFFAQIYINKSYKLFKITIITTTILALVTSIFRLLQTYTPSSYLYLIWALGSYAILTCACILFFNVVKFSTEKM